MLWCLLAGREQQGHPCQAPCASHRECTWFSGSPCAWHIVGCFFSQSLWLLPCPPVTVQAEPQAQPARHDSFRPLLFAALVFWQSLDVVAKTMERPFYMNPQRAIDFGVIDKVRSTFALSLSVFGSIRKCNVYTACCMWTLSCCPLANGMPPRLTCAVVLGKRSLPATRMRAM